MRIRVPIASFLFAVALGFSAGSAAAQTPTRKPVTLVLEWTGYQPQHFGFWLAKDRGWYAAEGLDVAIKPSIGSAQAMQVLVSGQAEFGNVAAASLVSEIGKSGPILKMVALFGQRDSLSMAYFVSTGIKTPKDLEGRKMGLVPGSMAAILWPSFAQATGIDTSKVQVLSWDFRTYWGILAAKQVDVSGNFTLGSTGAAVFKKRGEDVRQFVFSDHLPLLGSGIVVKSSVLEKEPEMVRKFVRATQRAWTYLRDEPKVAVPAAAAIIKREIEDAPAADLLAEYAYEMVPGQIVSAATAGKPVGWSPSEDWEKMIDLLKQYDPKMTRKPSVEEVMTNAVVGN
jgi:NitT/TauT family transport system substrate-binding protein